MAKGPVVDSYIVAPSLSAPDSLKDTVKVGGGGLDIQLLLKYSSRSPSTNSNEK